MKTHIAELFSADLKENQMTFDIQEPMVVISGVYAIVPIDDYKKLVGSSINKPEQSKLLNDIINWVKSDLAQETNIKIGKTATLYRNDKIRFLNKLMELERLKY